MFSDDELKRLGAPKSSNDYRDSSYDSWDLLHDKTVHNWLSSDGYGLDYSIEADVRQAFDKQWGDLIYKRLNNFRLKCDICKKKRDFTVTDGLILCFVCNQKRRNNLLKLGNEKARERRRVEARRYYEIRRMRKLYELFGGENYGKTSY